jgi:hypothetical protein
MSEIALRILALGAGDVIDEAAAHLVQQGYAVAQVDEVNQARKLIAQGGFDVVVLDGQAQGFSALQPKSDTERPWLVLESGGGRSAGPGHVIRLALPVGRVQLCDAVHKVMNDAHPPVVRPVETSAKTRKEKSKVSA